MSANITERDLAVDGGHLRLRDHGGSGRVVLCVPGLSANATSFDHIAEHLAGPAFHVVSVDLRGRGFSETTPPGSYGWPAHARDVLGVARVLGEPVDLVGHSMGTYVAMAAAAIDGNALRSLVLIDGLGAPDAGAIPPILAALERLGTTWPSADAYVEMVRSIGTLTPWSEYWERYLRYDLEDVDGGVRSRTDREAVLEDARWGGEHDQRELWPAVTQPTLLVRAQRPLGEGFIMSAADRDDFLRTHPNARGVEVDANHYAVANHPGTAAHIRAFLEAVDA